MLFTKKVFVLSVFILIISINFTQCFAGSEVRKCTRQSCKKIANSDIWKFCPDCGKKLPKSKLKKVSVDTVTGNVFKSAKHSYQIERPSKQWDIEMGADAKKINGSATVVIRSGINLYSMVIVEKLNITLEKYSELSRPKMSKRVKVFENTLKLNGYDCIQSKYTGEFNNLKFTFCYTIFAIGDFKYQIVSWSASVNDTAKTQAAFKSVVESFRVIESSAYINVKKLTDKEIEKLVVGKWMQTSTKESFSFTGYTNYLNNGTSTGNGEIDRAGKVIKFNFEATWKVKEGKIINTATKSSHPEFIKVGQVITDKVISVNEEEFKYKNNRGETITETRVISSRLAVNGD